MGGSTSITTSPPLFCLFLYTLFVATFLLVSALSNCNRLGDFSADPVLCMTRFLTEKSSILSITPVFSDYGQGNTLFYILKLFIKLGYILMVSQCKSHQYIAKFCKHCTVIT